MKKQKKENRAAIAKASVRGARVAPRKARLVVDLIRGTNVVNALGVLENTRRASNPIIKNVLKSAIANAVEKDSSVNPDELVITEARVDEGRTLRRMQPRAMGRATVIRKRSSHITLSVG
ncbi:MAG: 50S ribosomal protein L22 [SAR324 cluster bacterium]|uniref:Large ribosomal subunit protein uL22 n=1 Tax=SAR324 cluster bacterium TaxID=2024889 RepID=A0A2A4TAZ7_9DELT|nr:MAG: 50S ribosomal protein L22 [SAR324 cluster bacterium]